MQSLLWEQGFVHCHGTATVLGGVYVALGWCTFEPSPSCSPEQSNPSLYFSLVWAISSLLFLQGEETLACFRYRLLCPRAIALASPGEALFFLLPSELPRMFDFILRAKRLPVCPTEVDEFCFHSSPRISYGLMVVVVFSWGFWKTEFEASPSQFTLFFFTS